MYSQKTIQSLKPQWYMDLSQKKKKQAQSSLNIGKAKMWDNKPERIKAGTVLIAKATIKSITENKKYMVRGYFATLVTTIYCSNWHEFVIIKNNNGYTVKMNLERFNKFNVEN